MGLGGPSAAAIKANPANPTGRTLGGSSAYHRKRRGGRMRGALGGKKKSGPPMMTMTQGPGGGGGGGYRAPKLKKIETKATPPPELGEYAGGYREKVLGGLEARGEELREKGGAFMEEHTRQSQEELRARLEEARQRAAERGEPFDEKAAMAELARTEAGGRAEGLQAAEGRIDENLAAQAAAYQGGLPIVKAPSEAALAQKGQSLAEQQALMNYWLQKEGLGIEATKAAQQAQTAWMSMLASLLNTVY